MGCCGDREKGLVNVAADQKWDYIVRCEDWVLKTTLTSLEPFGLQVLILPDTLLLRLALDPRRHLLRRLCRRCVYRCQSSRFQ